MQLFATYGGSRADMTTWLRDASINTDRNLRLQYLAGLGLNLYQSAAIYQNMIRESRYPDRLFTGSESTLAELRMRIEQSLTASRPTF